MNMTKEERQKLIDEMYVQLSSRVLAHRMTGMDDGYHVVCERCESPIEERFLLAWYEAHSAHHWLDGPRDLNVIDKEFANQISVDQVLTWPTEINSPVKSILAPWFVLESDFLFIQPTICGCRVDFAILRWKWNGEAVVRSPLVIVECDGHDFHERTKDQAQRDRARDRAFQECGYLIMRFTGSEIWKDAAKCVKQVDRVLNGDSE